MNDMQTQLLLSRVRQTLQSDHQNVVAVLGWMARWHDAVTQQMEIEKKAVFIDQHRFTGLGPRIGYVIYTHRIGHTIVSGLKHERIPISPICWRPHLVHDAFRSCCRLLSHPPREICSCCRNRCGARN